jgi:hypothetical protein
MNRRIAAWHLARRFPCFDSLAMQLGKRPDTLRKELTGVEHYKWGVEDEEALVALAAAQKVANPLAPITAAAANAGALLVPLPHELNTEAPLFKCLADAAQEFGLFMATAAQALADGEVTANELREVEREFGKLVGKGQACLSNMGALHESGKPKTMQSRAASRQTRVDIH